MKLLPLLHRASSWTAFLAVFAVAQAQPSHTDNGSFLGYAYIKYNSYINANLANALTNFQYNYGTDILFVNCGSVNSSGQLVNGASQVSSAAYFLNSLASWEAANGASFTVFAYISGSLTTTNANYLDVSNATVRANFAAECAKFTSTSSPGSYIVGANRTFDGVFVDLEPAGGTSSAASTQFNNLKTLMDQVKSAVGGGKLTSFAAPQYNASSSSVWCWGPTYYYYMARHVDILMGMTYDSGSTSSSGYQSWMQQQTINILRAVSGEYWTDGSHSAPTNGVTVMLGFPAYPSNANHNPAYENTTNAAIGVQAGLGSIDATASNFFRSAAVFLTTDGTGNDGYASWSTDWNNLASSW